MGIEFFYGDKGLLINEIAPRTHNSAHFSIEACSSSQFDPVSYTHLTLPTKA